MSTLGLVVGYDTEEEDEETTLGTAPLATGETSTRASLAIGRCASSLFLFRPINFDFSSLLLFLLDAARSPPPSLPSSFL
jgi:hypothetical protein